MLTRSSNDVLSLEPESLSFVRFTRSSRNPQLMQAKSIRISDAFADAPVTPALNDAEALGDALRRLKVEAGSLDRVSLLLPDSWFRINLLDLAELPDRRSEAEEVIRWAVKRSLPIPAENLRIAFHVVGRTETRKRVLVVSSVEKTLSDIEAVFRNAGLWATTIEPTGLNLWNAIALREAETTRDRMLIHVRSGEFTTAMFRGAEPLFIRSRNLRGDRSVAQEVRLSASYLRENLQGTSLERCYLAGADEGEGVSRMLQEEFGAPVSRLALHDFVTASPGLEASHLDSEIIAATGVLAA